MGLGAGGWPRRKGCVQSAFLLLAAGAALYVLVIYSELHGRLRRSETLSDKYRQQQDSLSAQLQVVYEHRSRLEKSLQKERTDHKKTKEDFLVYKLDTQESLNKEKAQHEEIKSQYAELQQQHLQLEESHAHALQDHQQSLVQLQDHKANELAQLHGNIYQLREEGKQLRKAHQDLHVQLQEKRQQHGQLVIDHEQLKNIVKEQSMKLADAQMHMAEYQQLKDAVRRVPGIIPGGDNRANRPAPQAAVPAKPAVQVAYGRPEGYKAAGERTNPEKDRKLHIWKEEVTSTAVDRHAGVRLNESKALAPSGHITVPTPQIHVPRGVLRSHYEEQLEQQRLAYQHEAEAAQLRKQQEQRYWQQLTLQRRADTARSHDQKGQLQQQNLVQQNEIPWHQQQHHQQQQQKHQQPQHWQQKSTPKAVDLDNRPHAAQMKERKHYGVASQHQEGLEFEHAGENEAPVQLDRTGEKNEKKMDEVEQEEEEDEEEDEEEEEEEEEEEGGVGEDEGPNTPQPFVLLNEPSVNKLEQPVQEHGARGEWPRADLGHQGPMAIPKRLEEVERPQWEMKQKDVRKEEDEQNEIDDENGNAGVHKLIQENEEIGQPLPFGMAGRRGQDGEARHDIGLGNNRHGNEAEWLEEQQHLLEVEEGKEKDILEEDEGEEDAKEEEEDYLPNEDIQHNDDQLVMARHPHWAEAEHDYGQEQEKKIHPRGGIAEEEVAGKEPYGDHGNLLLDPKLGLPDIEDDGNEGEEGLEEGEEVEEGDEELKNGIKELPEHSEEEELEDEEDDNPEFDGMAPDNRDTLRRAEM
uniref:Golgi integral membrane protein 4-like isoform X2 n=1 Tax=Myxine glutinosa TaxID=7769 RepID=UPI00358E6BFB